MIVNSRILAAQGFQQRRPRSISIFAWMLNGCNGLHRLGLHQSEGVKNWPLLHLCKSRLRRFLVAWQGHYVGFYVKIPLTERMTER